MKRFFDFVFSLLGLTVLFPLLAVIALFIKIDSKGPIFFRQERIGKNCRHFKIHKFRSMVANAEQIGPGITVSGDNRITRVGRFLRQYKLDEFPQLINVLKGEMTLVGPRPEDPRYVDLYTPEQREVLKVIPGLTSLASLTYRDEESLLTGANWEQKYQKDVLPHKLALELAYLKQKSFWKDLTDL